MQTVDEWIRRLDLRPHPEGGYFREIYRSPIQVQPADGRPPRAALTTIYFLLPGGEVSRLHRVASDEVWHHYDGAEVELVVLDAELAHSHQARLGKLGQGATPVETVPAKCWQAARSLGDFSLVGCTVGPGFDFADFVLLRDLPEASARLRSRHPALAMYL